MKAFGGYLLLVISLARMSLSDDDPFSEENKTWFLNKIFELINMYRLQQDIPMLERSESMDYMAGIILNHYMIGRRDRKYLMFGMKYSLRDYTNDTKLDNEEANEIFGRWYSEKFTYVEPSNPPNIDADGSKHVAWEDAEEIGLAVNRINDQYGVMVIYTSRNQPSIEKPSASNNSNPSTAGKERNYKDLIMSKIEK